MNNGAQKLNQHIFQPQIWNGISCSAQYKIPRIYASDVIPQAMIPFSIALNPHCHEYNAFVCFYEDDYKFERFWKTPERYLPRLRQFAGVISPDFSTYQGMPIPFQEFNILRNYALGAWLQQIQGFRVICNVRTGDSEIIPLALDAAPQHSVISIGAHGNLKPKDNRDPFFIGLTCAIEKLEPSAILIYGTDCYDVFSLVQSSGIPLYFYPPRQQLAHLHRDIGGLK
ncbi:DUF4417 domain-containing protein [Aeriscardovia aeriphila]|uniref:DUF4417 domain-containing protein n=1 Tax=Aeriscardovia aeriphila TaxID=218139 RepID=A0A261FCG3_9BIFI|nr:DUF4417 domain-containing protein [Aeriscardovia aeriphila]NYI26286.1 hypothetical protein [Aeriscardovia aeriphila]OZG56832.1 hypothetical protein AEAE_0141 [Aeriscardovia aeriphila]